VKLLVDNQLPVALARFLVGLGVECRHVLDAGLAQASDRAIWRWAEDNRTSLISKDEDFFHLAGQPSSRVQFVWIRLGNCRTAQLLATFQRSWPRIRACLEAGDRIIEIR
jgi:predicted nuclease of predicted toxin-antitoxin system